MALQLAGLLGWQFSFHLGKILYMDGSDAFCDWLTVREDHAEQHLPFFAAPERRLDRRTGVVGDRLAPVLIEARNGSSFQIVSDGRRVTVSGNPSRYGRFESVLGLSVDESMQFVNEMLRFFLLPEFTAGQVVGRTLADRSGNCVGSGAVVTRCDVTTNIAVGSSRDFLMARQRLSPCRLKPTVIEGNVYYGAFSRERTVRLYDKAAELRVKAVKAARKVSASDGERIEALADCLADQGVVRVELVAKRALKAAISGRWASLSSEAMRELYMREFEAMTGDILSSEFPDFSVIPEEAAPWLALYLLGVDVKPRLSRPTFTKYRKLLLPFGYDLKVIDRPVVRPVVRRFEMKVPVLPTEYESPLAFDADFLSDASLELAERRRRG